jgi:hypothetical protein
MFVGVRFSEVEIEDDSDDDLQYEEVPEDEPDDEEVDFAKVLSTIKLKGASETKSIFSTQISIFTSLVPS